MAKAIFCSSVFPDAFFFCGKWDIAIKSVVYCKNYVLGQPVWFKRNFIIVQVHQGEKRLSGKYGDSCRTVKLVSCIMKK